METGADYTSATISALIFGVATFVVIYGLITVFTNQKLREARAARAKSKPRTHPTIAISPLQAIGATVFFYFAGQVLAQIIASLMAGVVFGIQNKTDEEAREILRNSVAIQAAVTGLFYGLVAGMVYLLLRVRRISWKKIGWIRPRQKDFGYAVLALGVYFALNIVLSVLIRVFVPVINLDQEQKIGFETASSPTQLVFVFLSLVILPPLVEEIVSRGLLFTGLRSKLPFITAAIVTSIFFGAAHLQFGSGSPLLWAAAIDTFVLSMVLCHLRERSGSLWPCITLHALKNGIAFTVLFVAPLF